MIIKWNVWEVWLFKPSLIHHPIVWVCNYFSLQNVNTRGSCFTERCDLINYRQFLGISSWWGDCPHTRLLTAHQNKIFRGSSNLSDLCADQNTQLRRRISLRKLLSYENGLRATQWLVFISVNQSVHSHTSINIHLNSSLMQHVHKMMCKSQFMCS